MSAAHAFDEMAESHEKVSLVGFSMGALLSTILAHERGDRVAALVTMSPPLHLDFISQSLLSVGRRLPLASIMPYKRKATGPDVSDPAIAAAMPSYDRTPVAAAVSLIDAQEVARDRATRISVPTLVQHGRHDHTTPIRSGRAFYALLKTPHRRFISYPRSWHILPLDVDHQQVEDDVVSFLNDPKAFADGETLDG